MERLETITTADLPSAVGHRFRTWECTYSRKKLIFISLCALRLLFMLSIWEQFKTPHKDMTVDEVIFSLSWPPSTSSFTSFNNSSSAQHSEVRLELPRAQYCVGDTLNVLVEMRNYAGCPKAYGGDFILARIHSPELQACASGEVTDLLSGSYRVRFRLFWPGEVHVSVRLIHSSEAVRVLQRDWMQDYGRALHKGTFISGEKRETSQCALRLSSDRPLCEYRKEEEGEYYACYKPQTLPCDSLTIMKSYMPPGPHRTKEEAQLLAQENTGIEIRNRFNPVTVFGCSDAAPRPTEKCVAGINSPFPGGYFYSNRWSSSFCQTGPFLTEEAITRCLKGKALYLLGDSTMRQWIEHLEGKLKGLRFIKKVEDTSQLAVDAHNNITVLWVRHSHPWIGYREVNIKTSVPIPEVLDSIAVGGAQEDAIVVIGIGQHFRPYPPEVFIRRLRNTRRAILRLRARNPQAKVIVKLENSRESKLTQFSNWYGYMQNRAQRRVFEDMNVALVDAWDMTVAANTFAVHPKGLIVSNEVAVALSFFCH
ncbi:NXPE family member 4-like isoform X1 [Anguilla rostrata]|uniref:NXPE family member 4-like isoform X1 n=1 Tax=Anguilla rostrata TaxID=7938 RepID=UPI0030D5444C